MSGGRQPDRRSLGDHIDRVYRAAWGLCGSREDAEDLVKETFARVLSRHRILRSDDDLGYLLRVLRKTFLTQRRTAARSPKTTAWPEDVQVGGPDTVRSQLRVEAQELYATLAALPPDFRDAIVAVDVLGLSYSQAARALRVREATVAARLHRARQRLATDIARRLAPARCRRPD